VVDVEERVRAQKWRCDSVSEKRHGGQRVVDFNAKRTVAAMRVVAVGNISARCVKTQTSKGCVTAGTCMDTDSEVNTRPHTV
jgi:hypothetical protein